jgi:hypothetical protein
MLKIEIYKIIILPLVLCRCKTCSLVLRKNRPKVFENRVPRRIIGPKGKEIIGVWRKLHNGELHILSYSPNIIRMIKSRRMRWAGHVARMGRRRMRTGFWWES